MASERGLFARGETPVLANSTGPCHRLVVPIRESRLCDKQPQVCSEISTVNRELNLPAGKVKKIRANTWHLPEASMEKLTMVSYSTGHIGGLSNHPGGADDSTASTSRICLSQATLSKQRSF